MPCMNRTISKYSKFVYLAGEMVWFEDILLNHDSKSSIFKIFSFIAMQNNINKWCLEFIWKHRFTFQRIFLSLFLSNSFRLFDCSYYAWVRSTYFYRTILFSMETGKQQENYVNMDGRERAMAARFWRIKCSFVYFFIFNLKPSKWWWMRWEFLYMCHIRSIDWQTILKI